MYNYNEAVEYINKKVELFKKTQSFVERLDHQEFIGVETDIKTGTKKTNMQAVHLQYTIPFKPKDTKAYVVTYTRGDVKRKDIDMEFLKAKSNNFGDANYVFTVILNVTDNAIKCKIEYASLRVNYGYGHDNYLELDGEHRYINYDSVAKFLNEKVGSWGSENARSKTGLRRATDDLEFMTTYINGIVNVLLEDDLVNAKLLIENMKTEKVLTTV